MIIAFSVVALASCDINDVLSNIGASLCRHRDADDNSRCDIRGERYANGTYAEAIDFIGTAQKIIIADSYDGVPVKTICKEVFKNASNTEVIIPDSVTTIGESAFYDCDSLTNVMIGK